MSHCCKMSGTADPRRQRVNQWSRAGERARDSVRGRESVLSSPVLTVAHICEQTESCKGCVTWRVNCLSGKLWKHTCACPCVLELPHVAPACQAWGLAVMCPSPSSSLLRGASQSAGDQQVARKHWLREVCCGAFQSLLSPATALQPTPCPGP